MAAARGGGPRGPEEAAARALEAIRRGPAPRACLVCGEDDFLRGRAARALGDALLPEADRTPFNFRVVDGEEESVPDLLGSLRTYSLFGGTTVIWVERTRLLVSGLNVEEVLQSASEEWAEAVRRGDDRGMTRAARDVLKVLAVRQLDLDALDPQAGSGHDDIVGLLPEGDPGNWLREVGALCAARGWRPGGEGGAAELAAALQEGWPEGNVLVLVAAACDRRLRLFQALRKHGLVLDAGPAAAGREAEGAARVRMEALAREAGARLSPGARALLERKVGFDLARLEREIDKLATYAGEGTSIEADQVEAVVGWTREEGQWEMANAVQERDLSRALRALRRMLDHGDPPVRIFFQLAAKLRDTLYARGCLEGPLRGVWRPGMADAGYRARVRPRVEALIESPPAGSEGWIGFLRSHPYALYKALQAAERYGREELLEALEDVYDTGWRLVHGDGPPAVLLEGLVARVLRPTASAPGAEGRGRGRAL